MTEAERQTLQNEHAACLAKANAIVAVLAGAELIAPIVAYDAFVPLKTAAAAWGIKEDSARKWVKCLARTQPSMATKRGAGRWWVHREALV